MSQQGPIREPPPPEDRNVDHGEPSSDAEAGELSFDDLPFAGPAKDDETLFVHKLQERVESALRETQVESADQKSVDSDIEVLERWSPRVQMLCIMGGSALCWAVILTPILLYL